VLKKYLIYNIPYCFVEHGYSYTKWLSLLGAGFWCQTSWNKTGLCRQQCWIGAKWEVL